MKASEIRSLTEQELELKERALREELQKARFKKHTGELVNTAQLRKVRRDLARVLTETRSRRIAAANSAN